MVALLPATWQDTDAYALNAEVDYNGVKFRNTTAVAKNANGNANPIGNSSWEFDSVLRITDYYSLQYAVEFAINTDDDMINDSIPLFIQNTERKIGKLLRSPAQLASRTFTVDSDSKFAIPSDILEVYHLRINSTSRSSTLRERGNISIQFANRTDFEKLRQYYEDSNIYYDYNNGQYDWPLARTDDQYIYIAPALDSGTVVELQYYQAVPELGSTVNLVDSNYQPTGATQVVTRNLWTANCPHLLKAGACMQAAEYLKNQDAVAMWDREFKELLLATETEFRRFDTSGDPHTTQESSYIR